MQIKDESRKFSAGSGIRSVVAYGGTSTSHQRDQIRMGGSWGGSLASLARNLDYKTHVSDLSHCDL